MNDVDDTTPAPEDEALEPDPTTSAIRTQLLLLVAFVACAIVLLAFAASTLASSGGCGGG